MSVLLLGPWAVKAFWESWGPRTGKAGTRCAAGNLREALLAAAWAGQKLREQDRVLVAGQAIQLPGDRSGVCKTWGIGACDGQAEAEGR